MNFYPELENKRVLLRPLEAADLGLLLPVIEAQPELCRFMSAPVRNREELGRFIGLGIKMRQEEQGIPFLVFDKREQRAVGTTRFGSLDRQHRRVEIGWTWIDSRLHHSGLNKAMKYLMLQHAFEVLGLNRVEIKTNEHNIPSRKAIESIGGRYEGLFRHHMVNPDGSLRNTVYYSLLKEEWPEVKARVFQRYLADWE